MATIITRPITFTPKAQPTQTRYLPSTATQRPIAYTAPQQPTTITRQPGLTTPTQAPTQGRTLTPIEIQQRAQSAINRYPSAGFSNYVVMNGYWYGVSSADGMTMQTRLNPATADTYPNPAYSVRGTGTPTYTEGSAGWSQVSGSARPEAPGVGSTKAQIRAYAESLSSWEREQLWRQIPISATAQEIEDWWGQVKYDLPTQERRTFELYGSMLSRASPDKARAIERQYSQQKQQIVSSSGILTPTKDGGYVYASGERFTPTASMNTDRRSLLSGSIIDTPLQAPPPQAPGMIAAIARTQLGQDYLSRGSILQASGQPSGQPPQAQRSLLDNMQVLGQPGTTQAPPAGFVSRGIFDEQSRAFYSFFKGLSDEWNKQVTEPISKSFKQPETKTPREGDLLSYFSVFSSEYQKTQPWNYPAAASRGVGMTIEFPGMVGRGADILAANIGLFPALAGAGLIMQGEGVIQGLKERPQEFIVEQSAMLLTTHYGGKAMIKAASQGSPIWAGVARIPSGEYIKASPGILSKGGMEPVYSTYGLLYTKRPFSGTYSGGKTILGFSALREPAGPRAVVKLEGRLQKVGTDVSTSYHGVLGERGLLLQTKKTPIAMQSGLDLERPPLGRTEFVVLRPTFRETALSPLQYELWEKAYKAKDVSTSFLYKPEVKGKIGDLPHAAFPTPAYRAMFGVISSYGKDVVTYGSRVLNEIWVGKGYGRTAEPRGTIADVDLATYAKILPEYHQRMVAARDTYIKAPHGKFTFLKPGLKGQSQIQGTTPEYKGFGTHTLEEFGIFEQVKLFEVETAFGQKIWVPGPDYFLSAKSGGAFAGIIKPAKGKHAGKMTLVINRPKDIPDVYSESRSMAETMYTPVRYDVGGIVQARKTRGARILEEYSDYVKRFAEEELPKITDKPTVKDVSARFGEIELDILKGVPRRPRATFDILRDLPVGGRIDRETGMLFPPSRKQIAETIPTRRKGYQPIRSAYYSGRQREGAGMIIPSLVMARQYQATKGAREPDYRSPLESVKRGYTGYRQTPGREPDYLGSVLDRPYKGYQGTRRTPEPPYTPYRPGRSDYTSYTPYRGRPGETPYRTPAPETPYYGGRTRTTTTPYTGRRETPYKGGRITTTPYTGTRETPYTGTTTTTTPYRAPKEIPYSPTTWTPIPVVPPRVPVITRPVIWTRTKKRKREEYPGKLQRVWPEFFPYTQHAPVISPTSMLKGVLSGKKLKPVRS